MLFRWLIGYPVSLLIMPSQLLLAKDEPNYIQARERKDIQGIPFTNHTVTSTNQANINFCEATKNPNNQVKDQKIIIHAVGNGDCYENHMNEYAHLAAQFPDYRIVGLNFRGTMKSTGRAWSENDWIEDIKSVVKQYQDQGVSLQNILLNGHSLGGALATIAAAKIYEEAKDKALKEKIDPKTVKSIKLLNNRSFANATEYVLMTMLGKRGTAILAGLIYGSIFGILFGASLLSTAILTTTLLLTLNFINPKISYTLMRPLIKCALWLSFGTLDAYSAYKSLPEDCVDHLVAKNDIVIGKMVGLHDALRPSHKAKKIEYRKIILENHDAKKKAAALNELINLKDCNLILANDPCEPLKSDAGMIAHNESLLFLRTQHKARGNSKNQQISGEEVLERKIRRLMK
jgi:hypothetical protein